MIDELVDICDENNNLLGIQKMGNEAHKNGLWHRASHVWIYNSKGEILLQLRAKNKELYPDMWDISAAGQVGAGEEPIVSGLREIEEEIGLSVKEGDLDFFKVKKCKAIFRNIKDNEFCYVYLFKFDGDIKNLNLQDEEVQSIQFLPFEKIEEELKTNPEKYVPHGDYWFEVINKVKQKLNL
ncbi:MAG: NUDIX domain-containing protein [bacterium]|nr:NUDIX domain-containing protein [bacterium]